MKKVFIDCGYHLGEGLQEFITNLGINESWKIYVFEANPACEIFNKIPNNLNITAYNKAVWIHNDGVIFNQENNTASKSPTAGSTSNIDGWGSCVADLQSVHTYDKQVKVESVDFAKWIMQFKDCDVYCKMDIEGAEFPVLKQMIEQQTLSVIKELWVEWHDMDLPNEDETSRELLISKIEKYCKLNSWK